MSTRPVPLSLAHLVLWLLAIFILCLLAASGFARAQEPVDPSGNAVVPGEVYSEPPTPYALGFRWAISGDANGNATADLTYRRADATEWLSGLPLFRATRAKEWRGLGVGGTLAGSLVGLAPNTSYQVRLRLEDPDGGSAQRDMLLRTSDEPRLPADLRAIHVRPFSADRHALAGTGAAESPINGLVSAIDKAVPGDLLLLAPGTYLGLPLRLRRPGLSGQPIIIQGAGNGPSILDGKGASVLLDLSDLDHIWIQGLRLRNADTLILADRAHDLVIRGNRFEVTRAGYVSKGAVGLESRGHFVTDNTFLGPTVWPRSLGIEHIFGIGVSGSGHVIAHNHLEGLGDCIRGAWVDGEEGLLSASDIFANEIQTCTDDGIEIDHSDANVRVSYNRITNSFAAVSMQPVFGGPVYVYRNVIHNTLYSPFKLHNNTSGVHLFHNTSTRSGIPFFIRTSTETVGNSVTRNNLFVGSETPALVSTATMIRCDFDSDGYATKRGDFARWNRTTYHSIVEARRSGEIYRRFGAFLLEAEDLFEAMMVLPVDPAVRYDSSSVRPLINAESGAVDRGARLATFNDGFAGAAPDLGCCELGSKLPEFGPRAPWRE